MRLVVDMIEWCAAEMPLMHPVSISGYHIREAGSTAAQELAFTLADGFAYVDACVARGLDVDAFAPRLSFFFNAHLDFFEEIAKYRAARRIWATRMRDHYGAKDSRSLLMRFHTQTAGVSLTAQQPEVNLVRTAIEALAAVLGGTQSLHTNSFDEALALPTEHAVRLALRTQQVIAHETGVVNTADPLGGSYYLEHLTDELERQAYDYFDRIEKLGGVIPAIEQNFMQREIAEASFRYQGEVERGERVIVGVNRYEQEDEQPLEILRIDPALEQKQIERVQATRARRDSAAVEAALARLRAEAGTDTNLMPAILDASRVYVTMGEMCDTLRQVWGTWRETPVLLTSTKPGVAVLRMEDREISAFRDTFVRDIRVLRETLPAHVRRYDRCHGGQRRETQVKGDEREAQNRHSSRRGGACGVRCGRYGARAGGVAPLQHRHAGLPPVHGWTGVDRRRGRRGSHRRADVYRVVVPRWRRHRAVHRPAAAARSQRRRHRQRQWRRPRLDDRGERWDRRRLRRRPEHRARPELVQL